jgi:cytoskeletal protein CcmA (bactofilin family)
MSQKKDYLDEDVSIISSGAKIEGDLTSEGNVRIDGAVTGNISVNGNLTVGELSELKGEIKAKNITMSGKIIGKVVAQEKLKLESKSALKGDIITKFLIIEEGAILEGNSHMNSPNLFDNKKDEQK